MTCGHYSHNKGWKNLGLGAGCADRVATVRNLMEILCW